MGRVKTTKLPDLLKKLKEKLSHDQEEYDKIVESLKPLSMKKACKLLEALILKKS